MKNGYLTRLTLSKAGNTWFKLKRNEGRKVGFLNVKVIVPAMVSMDTMKLARNGEITRKAYQPRAARAPVGLVHSGYGMAKAARREGYFNKLWITLAGNYARCSVGQLDRSKHGRDTGVARCG